MNSISLPAGSPLLKNSFLYGTATSSFQIEGDVACDHIARWREDFDILLDLNVDAYRFSISWPRVITQEGELNPKGVAFYKTLVDALNEKALSHLLSFITGISLSTWKIRVGGFTDKLLLHLKTMLTK
jgi:beta-glucosidase